jgi:Glucose-6-phosphate isomerase
MEEPPHLAVQETVGFVDDLKATISMKFKIPAIEFDKICICGMGGSAIGGDILIDFLSPTSTVPITVIRSMDIPHWVNDKTLVIACTYSGNTNETLSMYDQAKARNCPIVAMTAGGKLEQKCIEDGTTMIKFRPGMQPRNAVGITVGCMANVIETVGGAKCKKDIKKLIPELYKLRNMIGFKNPDSYAKRIAEKMHGTVPVIYSTAGIAASSVRWKTQLNETSKMMAFNGSIPEFNHNEITGWAESVAKFNCKPVFLYEEDAPGMMKDMATASIETLKSFGVEPIVISIRGKTVLERSLRATMFGDFISLYLAFMNDVDPIEVRSITSFKKRVAKIMNRKKAKKTAAKM